ncbi:hypothetical protein SH2C18_43810 [Clostridium sediminicola]|uniref:hypothetical protein n=1 Tax=Clostridium sediminicola TaxID=3114879 RepID=UPI0031F23C1D
MGKKTAKISFVVLLALGIIGVSVVNIRLNRRIYSDIIFSIDKQESENNKKGLWNLDYMEQVLSNPNKYKGSEYEDEENTRLFDDLRDDIAVSNNSDISNEFGGLSFNSVPKIKMLLNKEPFDFRISTKNYIISFNGESIEKLKRLEKLK